ncbi:MAG: polynucleotide adenylyltransferase PcnB [Sphaerochaetaceae bacterium]|nr:polynucleotide adenylyltransferase PcnB [Sphaerochaetaceae bacterium]MDY5967492.1 polynucleotide adenylyltransferase PcnB [Sphaerochaetaceae bacterium]
MLKRYTTAENGKTKLLSLIYTQDEHKIDNKLIDKDAYSVLDTLNANGYEAYVVGGAVRDLLIGCKPKDFDIVTEATPRTVRRLFRNSRIIGRRFRLVHVVFPDQIIEVSTFRSEDATDSENNIFGTLTEDAQRRDFTINSLYYNPSNSRLLDFHGGFNDLNNRILRAVIPIDVSFTGDPIRMIRAVKYAVKCSLEIDSEIKGAFYKYSKELTKVSESRMVEEVNKILLSGHSLEILKRLDKYDLLIFIMPRISEEIMRKNAHLNNDLKELDKAIQSGIQVTPSDAYAALMSFIINKKEVEKLEINDRLSYVMQLLHKALRPLGIPWKILIEAGAKILETKNIEFLKVSKNYDKQNTEIQKAKKAIKALTGNIVKNM